MITKKQKAVLDYIKKYQKKKTYAPSLEEIQKHFKHASVSTAHFYVKKLQEQGLLQKEDNQPRAISALENEKMRYLVYLPRWDVEIEAKDKTEALLKAKKCYDENKTEYSRFNVIKIKALLPRIKCPACGEKEDPDGRCRCVNDDAW